MNCVLLDEHIFYIYIYASEALESFNVSEFLTFGAGFFFPLFYETCIIRKTILLSINFINYT
jgi:hypothetical protein